MLDQAFDRDQISPNIAKHNVRCPDKACILSNTLPNMELVQILDQMLDRLHKALLLSNFLFCTRFVPTVIEWVPDPLIGSPKRHVT